MKTLIFIFTGFIFCFELSAQNYQAFNSKRTVMYSNEYDYIKGIKVDSIHIIDKDSIFYFNKLLRNSNYECANPYGNSFLGEKVIIKMDGLNIFFNENDDTIKIKTDALLNEEWLAYKILDSIKIIAKCENYNLKSYFWFNDSIKTISFQAYDKNFNPIEHKINSMQIQLSKNYGLIIGFDFYLFPNFYNIYNYMDFVTYELYGMSNPKFGCQNLTWKQVYDYEIGDEFHIRYDYLSWGSSWSENKQTIIYSGYKYITKEIIDDTIIYNYIRHRTIVNKTGNENVETTITRIHDTLQKKITDNPDFDKLPGEPVFESYFVYSNIMTSSTTKTKPSEYEWYHGQEDDEYWCLPVLDICYPNYLSYRKGLGGPYYWCETYFSPIVEIENKLVYYKKGETTWGTPYTFSDIEKKEITPDFLIYPNPATDRFYIRSKTEQLPYTFELIDVLGRQIIEKTIYSEEYVIHTKKLNPGIFFYRIYMDPQKIKTGRILIQ